MLFYCDSCMKLASHSLYLTSIPKFKSEITWHLKTLEFKVNTGIFKIYWSLCFLIEISSHLTSNIPQIYLSFDIN